MKLLQTITHRSRLHDIRFCKRVVGDGEVLFAAAEDKKLSVYEVSSDPEIIPKLVAELIGHENRYGSLVSNLYSGAERLL